MLRSPAWVPKTKNRLPMGRSTVRTNGSARSAQNTNLAPSTCCSGLTAAAAGEVDRSCEPPGWAESHVDDVGTSLPHDPTSRMATSRAQRRTSTLYPST